MGGRNNFCTTDFGLDSGCKILIWILVVLSGAIAHSIATVSIQPGQAPQL